MAAAPAPGSLGRHPGDPENDNDGDHLSGAASATETAPLLQHRQDGADYDGRGGTSSLGSTLTNGSTTPTTQTTLQASARDGAEEEEQAGDGGADDDDQPAASIAPGRAFALIMSMWALIFLQASNMSGMTMAQSDVATELDAYESAMWFTSSYLMAMSSLAPLVGKLAAVFSPATMVVVSSCAFALGAIVCSQATTFAVFIAGRVLLGAGGAGIMTLSLILIIQYTSKKRRGLFIGLVSAGFTVGMSSGAIVFGALLSVVGWRALFYLQVPLALLGGLGVWLSLPRAARDDVSKPAGQQKTALQKLAGIDYLGAATMIITLVLFLYGLSAPTVQWTPIALSAISLGLFLFVEHHVASDPIITLEVLRSRGVLLSCLAQLGFMAARWTVLFYAPIFVLAVRGLSPAVAGATLVPTNIGFGSGGLLVGWLHIRRGGSFWLPCLVALSLFGFALLGISFTSNAAAPAWLYVLTIFANGLCTGAALNYTLAHTLHHARPGETQYVAASLLATFRGFAGSFGTAIGGGIFGRTLKAQLSEGFRRLDGSGDMLNPGREKLINKLIGSPALVFGGDLSPLEKVVAIQGYEVSLRVLYQLAAALTVLVVLVQAGTGWTAPASRSEEEEETRERFMGADANMEA
ncbi:hypothetical protein MCOR19_004072 [Pyricularia oryzae]|nr:hypothetical protein MCOR19_004072 [Pyricularia oryzae]KAI6458614.1 hypothetical protein MCOR15_006304 [Pyricularia oryzae]KAI6479025.1 hypothetical protein MCOR18_005903 [Pyricularia oryzae]KAI6503028.1 hypothetical protein MCOR11_000974 [Pyricularia oryzae]KAI6532266.1 hypothetical protein MCOR10_002939 [Pyricularia oryzae]